MERQIGGEISTGICNFFFKFKKRGILSFHKDLSHGVSYFKNLADG